MASGTSENPAHESSLHGDCGYLTVKLLAFLLLFAVAGCATEGSIRPPSANTDRLVSYARSLIGTPYKYGGNSPEHGFDCSGFVDHVFLHETNIRLPRSSLEISRRGNAVSKKNLRSGDLVFFNTLHSKFSHVGIYLGGDRFIHAPSNGGAVRVEDLQDDYWGRSYNGARRIIFDR
ncbi:MAG: C40 family peptidase [Gallionella sp.]